MKLKFWKKKAKVEQEQTLTEAQKKQAKKLQEIKDSWNRPREEKTEPPKAKESSKLQVEKSETKYTSSDIVDTNVKDVETEIKDPQVDRTKENKPHEEKTPDSLEKSSQISPTAQTETLDLTKEVEKTPEQVEKDRLKKKVEMKTKGSVKKESRSDYDVTYEHDKKEKKKFRLKIVLNKKGCIASGHCVLSDLYNFKLDKDFKADLVGGKELPGPVKGIYVKEIETDEPHMVINAAKTCTPKVIGVIDLDTGKRIAP